eukprot:6967153-Prorocentrum_lima.AAC.1
MCGMCRWTYGEMPVIDSEWCLVTVMLDFYYGNIKLSSGHRSTCSVLCQSKPCPLRANKSCFGPAHCVPPTSSTPCF